MKGGLQSVVAAVRTVLTANELLAARQIYQDVPDADAELPCIVFSVAHAKSVKELSGDDGLRYYRVSLKCLVGSSRRTSVAIPYLEAFETMMRGVYEGEAAQSRLNEHLVPRGWDGSPVLEGGEITPYSDVIGKDLDVKRWHFGTMYNLAISPV